MLFRCRLDQEQQIFLYFAFYKGGLTKGVNKIPHYTTRLFVRTTQQIDP